MMILIPFWIFPPIAPLLQAAPLQAAPPPLQAAPLPLQAALPPLQASPPSLQAALLLLFLLHW
jgi:hypothetical protein